MVLTHRGAVGEQQTRPRPPRWPLWMLSRWPHPGRGNGVEIVVKQVGIGVQRHRRLGVSQHPLQRFHVGTRRHRQDAAVCRRSCGVIVGNVSSACWHWRTASSNTRARQLELRSTPPRISANTSSSRALPTIDAGMSSASPAGNGTDRATSVQLSSQASSGMEYADAARRCFSQLTKCPVCGRATFCGPHSRSPV